NAEKGKGFYGFSDQFKVSVPSVTVAGRGVNVGIAHARDHKFYPIVRLLTLTPKQEQSIFFFQYGINQFNIFIESTGVPQLTGPQISTYHIASPTLPEQEKIASFLSAVDKKNQQLTAKKELLEQYKEGVMQKIFSQEIRFTDDNGGDYPEWEEKKLGDLGCINPRTPELPDKFVYIDLESVAKGRLLKEEIVFSHNAPSRAQRVMRKGDILFQMVRPYQKNNLLFNFDGDYVASTGYAQIRAKEDSMFLYLLLHNQPLVNLVIRSSTGSNYPAINSTDLNVIPIIVPSITEQKKIGAFLQNIDKKIESVQSQLIQTQTFKKELLQQMFV
ncbi:restriction endonuclease subunit S, partial [bacterium]|nr:restriction endonuclease subunit S [bacterium]